MELNHSRAIRQAETHPDMYSHIEPVDGKSGLEAWDRVIKSEAVLVDFRALIKQFKRVMALLPSVLLPRSA